MHRWIIACILVALMAQGAWAEGETAPCGAASGSDTDYTMTPYNVKNNEAFNMAAIGDSITLGTGLNKDEKYFFLVAKWLSNSIIASEKCPQEISIFMKGDKICC